jgi:NAD(P)-dependent dehydrogenase (short-subunit alcohol dehydrogenase family)
MRVNVIEPASLAREAVAHFRETGGGIIVTISSWAAQAGSALTQVPAYAASKAAIRNLTQTIARNYASEGVLAYTVAPGIVRTSMSEISAEARGGIEKVHAALAMGEMVPPEEVAALVAFLAGGSCRHLTGATLDMNGASYVR